MERTALECLLPCPSVREPRGERWGKAPGWFGACGAARFRETETRRGGGETGLQRTRSRTPACGSHTATSGLIAKGSATAAERSGDSG